MSHFPLRHVLFAGYVLVALGAVAWPGPLLLAGRLEPLVLGLPPALAWNLGWIAATFVALVLYDATTERT